MKLSPWFDCRKEVPTRSGVYRVANSAVCALSEKDGKQPFGWVLQWWNNSEKRWLTYANYGYYGRDGKWQGILK